MKAERDMDIDPSTARIFDRYDEKTLCCYAGWKTLETALLHAFLESVQRCRITMFA